jgi:hypothetical protein
MVMFRRLVVAAGVCAAASFASATAAPVLAARQAPDSTQVEALMREAHALLRDHGTGRLSSDFVDYFNRRAAGYGLPPLERPARLFRNPVAEVIDTLLANRAVADAWARAQELDLGVPGGSPHMYMLARRLAQRGATAQALDLALRSGSPDEAIAAGLTLAIVADGRETAVREWLRTTQLTTGQRTQLRIALLTGLLYREPHRALAEILAEPSADVRSHALLAYLTSVLNPQTQDRVASALMAATLQVEDADERRILLERMADLCDGRPFAACDEWSLPPRPLTAWRLSVELSRAVQAGELARADSVLEMLAELGVGKSSRYSLVGEALTSCMSTAGCTPRPLPEIAWWRARLGAAADASQPAADTVRAQLVRLWATDDVPHALRWLAAVADSALASEAGLAAARRTLDLDFHGALALAHSGARGVARRLSLPPYVHVRLRSQGSDELAEEMLGLERSSAIRFLTRLDWVTQIYQAGRVTEARDLVFAAIEDWKPEADPIMCINCLRIIATLGQYDALIAWARALPEPAARASALITIAEGAALRRSKLPPLPPHPPAPAAPASPTAPAAPASPTPPHLFRLTPPETPRLTPPAPCT